MESAFFPWRKFLTYTIAVLAVLFAYSWITSPLIVTVTGLGEVSAKAETATLTFSLSSNSDNPQVAISTVKTVVGKIKTELKNAGIPESDIYESQVTVYPASAVVSGASGFQSTVSMGIKTNQIANLDNLVANLYGLGAVVVTQPVLSVAKAEDLEKEAYNLAIKDAKKKAWSVALSNWKLIRKVVLIEQTTTNPTSTVTTKADTASQVENKYSPEDGLIKISKVVSVSYKLW